MDPDRSPATVEMEDLDRLAAIAKQDQARFFETRPEYRGRIIATALCQGAALHYVDVREGRRPPNGVKDFDVWTFFAAVPGERFPADRRNTHVDFGPSRFGSYANEPTRFRHYEGRRVDLLMRALSVGMTADPLSALQAYLTEARTRSAQLLAEKAVVLLDPSPRRGEVVWPARSSTR